MKLWTKLVRWLAREELAAQARRASMAEGALNFAYKQAREQMGKGQEELTEARKANEEAQAKLGRISKQLQDSRETVAILQDELLAAKLQERPPFETEFADEAPQLSHELRDIWRHFLATNEAGKVLQRMANFYEQAQNRSAVLRTEGAERNAGFAHGWHAATMFFFRTLSADVRPQQDTDTQASGADALRERLAS